MPPPWLARLSRYRRLAKDGENLNRKALVSCDSQQFASGFEGVAIPHNARRKHQACKHQVSDADFGGAQRSSSSARIAAL